MHHKEYDAVGKYKFKNDYSSINASIYDTI